MQLIMLRRVVGHSMEPTLKPGQIVLASSMRKPLRDRLVIAKHGNHEVIKRVYSINAKKVILHGDNTDSAHNLTLPIDSIISTVFMYKNMRQ